MKSPHLISSKGRVLMPEGIITVMEDVRVGGKESITAKRKGEKEGLEDELLDSEMVKMLMAFKTFL